MPRGPALVGFPVTVVPSPTGCSTPLVLLGGCTRHVEAGRKPGSCCQPLAPRGGSFWLAPRCTRTGPPCWVVHSGSLRLQSWGCMRSGLFACVDPVTHASSCSCTQPCDGVVNRRSGAVLCRRRHLALPVVGCHARVPCTRVHACVSRPGQAGRPPGRVLVRLTTLVAVLVVLAVVVVFRPPPGPFAPPLLWLPCCLASPLQSVSCAPVGSGFLCFPALVPWALPPRGLWLLFLFCSPAFFVVSPSRPSSPPSRLRVVAPLLSNFCFSISVLRPLWL